MQSLKQERRRMRGIMARRTRGIMALSAVTLLLTGTGATRSWAPVAAQAQAQTPKSIAVKRGEYLSGVGGCNDCHTPSRMGPKGPEKDMARKLSGHPAGLEMGPAPIPTPGWVLAGSGSMTAFAGPWGVSYAANLTPDKETGLGNWTEAMFISAMRTGKHAGVSRPILPPMPWESLNAMTDADIKAVFAYLRSLPPMKNAVPPPVLAPPPPSAAARR